MRRYGIIIILLTVLLGSADVVNAQEPAAENTSSDFNMSGSYGATMIGDTMWYEMSLRPELVFGKFGIGLNIRILYNDNEGIRNEDWNTARKLWQIVDYVRWAHKGDPVYVRLGSLYSATLGHGLIMRYYNNRLDDYNRKIGAQFDVNQTVWGYETFANDIVKPIVLGARAYYRPFPDRFILNRIAFGATYVTDRNPGDEKVSSLVGSVTKNRSISATVYGVDVELPLIDNSAMRMILYDDIAKLHPQDQDYRDKFSNDNEDWGNAVGLSNYFMGISLSIESRTFRKYFMAPYFDVFYEVERENKLTQINNRTERLNGWYAEAAYNFFGLLDLKGSYEDYKNSLPRVHAEVTTAKIMERYYAKGMYDKKDMSGNNDFFELNRSSVLTSELGYSIASNIDFVIIYRSTFDENGQSTKSSAVQTRFTF